MRTESLITASAHQHTAQVQPTAALPRTTLPTTCDIAILGAGPVGSALALQLAACWPDPGQIVLIDSKPWSSTNADSKTQEDPRTLAFAAGSVDLLNRLGAWTTLAPQTQAITHIHVSRRGQFGRTLMTAAEHRVPALGYVARYNALLSALENKLQQQLQTATPIQVLRPFRVQVAQADGQLNLENPAGESHTLQARCIVHAEGGLFGQPTAVQKSAETAQTTLTHDSGQTALLTTVRAQHPQAGYAYERFCDHGPLALLPNGVGTYAVVWCGQAATMQALAQADAPTFNAALAQAFGTRLGQFERVSPCSLYPLGLRVQREVVDGRRVTLGNAAQTLHPVAGQGLNLGLRDSQTLVQLLHQYGPQQLDQALAQYRQQRRVDRWGTIGLTELMSQAFTWPVASGVAAGLLGLLDMLPSARRSFARRMMFGHR